MNIGKCWILLIEVDTMAKDFAKEFYKSNERSRKVEDEIDG